MRRSAGRRADRRGSAAAAVLACLTVAATVLGVVPGAYGEPEDQTTGLYLVTLPGPGTSGIESALSRRLTADRMLAAQDSVLEAVGAPEPVYRWTTALNGFAVVLDTEQARELASLPGVAKVEENAIRRLAAITRTAPARTTPGSPTRKRAGAGVVIGFVDTGIDPDSRAFSTVSTLGAAPADFRGVCAEAPDDEAWDAGACNTKVVAAHHFVAGFGAERLRANASLSPVDTDGHGTAAASVAAGAQDVPVTVNGRRLGRFSGVAPRARVAAYKACWSAPDPSDDGCATADLVTAIDRATADGVDVLNLSVGGPSTVDTVERALLGATEAGVLVAAAAGNEGARAYAAHPSPWVLTVGAANGRKPVGLVRAAGGPDLVGAMAVSDPVGPVPLVLSSDAAAPGADPDDARVCAHGSLDARSAAGAVVVCERGRVPRLEKSSAVDLADGVGMVLVNVRRGSSDADLHALPTVHLSATDGERLLAWAERTRSPRVALAYRGVERLPFQVAGYSSGGDPTSRILKPDLVAEGTGVLAATPDGWNLVTGTSVAAARVSGQAAVLLGRRGATPAEVRSALVTTAQPLPDTTGLSAGAGRAAIRPRQAIAVLPPARQHRDWIEGRRTTVDQPQLLLSNGVLRGRRTLTNISGRTIDVAGTIMGFRGHLTVSPTAATLAPGESFTFTVRMDTAPHRTDSGAIVWRTDGRATRIPVVVTR